MNHVRPNLRFRILNSCFTNRKQPYWSTTQLLERLAQFDIVIDRRSLLRDIKLMQEDTQLGYLAPLKYSKKFKGYYYEDPNYSIEIINISDEELVSLLFCKHLYKHFKGSNVADTLNGVLDKVITTSRPLLANDEQVLLVDNTIMMTQGLQHLGKLLNAVHQQQPLKMTHQKYDDEKVNTHIFHPYFLKAYNGRLYVYGKSSKRNINLTFGLDRILSLEEATDVAFVPNTRINPVDFFKNIIGVWMGKGPVQEVKLRFIRSYGYYVKSKPMHDSQQIIEDGKDGLIVTLQLIPNIDLKNILLSMGKSVKVLAPESLADELQQEHTEAAAQYVKIPVPSLQVQ